MEAIFCSVTSVDFLRTTGRRITEQETLQDRSCFELLLSLTTISSSLRYASVAIVVTDELGVTLDGDSCLLLKFRLNNCMEGLRKAIFRVTHFRDLRHREQR
jgi:hypothetical protein